MQMAHYKLTIIIIIIIIIKVDLISKSCKPAVRVGEHACSEELEADRWKNEEQAPNDSECSGRFFEVSTLPEPRSSCNKTQI